MKTDSQLQQDVIAELKWESAINDTQITVSVKSHFPIQVNVMIWILHILPKTFWNGPVIFHTSTSKL